MDLRRIGKPLALLAAAGLFVLILHGPLDALLREPLTRLWLLVDSLPQQLIWGALAIAGFVVVLKFPRRTDRERVEPRVTPPGHETQLERLTKLIHLGETSPWARDVLRWRLGETAACLRALREGMDLDEARKELRAGEWPTHPRVAAVLQPRREGEGSTNESYGDELALALDAIEQYAQGGSFEAN